VTDLHIAMPAINERSSARLEIKAANEESMEQAVNILRDVAREKKLLIIEPLEECP
jgi:ACT domain-containing protein